MKRGETRNSPVSRKRSSRSSLSDITPQQPWKSKVERQLILELMTHISKSKQIFLMCLQSLMPYTLHRGAFAREKPGPAQTLFWMSSQQIHFRGVAGNEVLDYWPHWSHLEGHCQNRRPWVSSPGAWECEPSTVLLLPFVLEVTEMHHTESSQGSDCCPYPFTAETPNQFCVLSRGHARPLYFPGQCPIFK